MKVYKPVYAGRWEVWELDSNLLRRIPSTHNTVCYYKKHVGFYGALFDADCIFKTREAAERWINKGIVSSSDYFDIDKNTKEYY